jgi:hypothetical protein
MKKPVLISVLLAVAILAFIVYLTMGMVKHRVEVCMAFGGQTNCRTASGATVEFATKTAIQNACAEIASGVTDSIKCEHTDPQKVNVLK